MPIAGPLKETNGNKTIHIHMVEADFEHWDRLLFRDYLIDHPDVAREYSNLKEELSEVHHADRVAYTESKTNFIRAVTKRAKEYYRKGQQSHAPGALLRAGMLDDLKILRQRKRGDMSGAGQKPT